MEKFKAIAVWGFGLIIILGAFMIFVDVGWPGKPDDCINDIPDTCYCEEFKKDDVLKGRPGVRQPVNTWFNLYSLLTALIVAGMLTRDRKLKNPEEVRNIISSSSWIADLYVFGVLFLGLGSMWFHASLTHWGGLLDGMSMYVYASFLVFYTLRRFFDSDTVFWLGYLCSVLFFTLLHCFGVPSFVSLGILVTAYMTLEIYIWVRTGKIMQGKTAPILYWVFALLSFGTATFFQISSQTGNFLCDPKSSFQPHGLLWHPLAGVMAVLLYFFWREADDVKDLESKF